MIHQQETAYDRWTDETQENDRRPAKKIFEFHSLAALAIGCASIDDFNSLVLGRVLPVLQFYQILMTALD